MGHPSRAANIPTIAINPTAPLNVKPKKSGKLANVSDGPQVVIKDSHNELKAILADPPRRRASSSAVETLSAPLALRSVSAPMVYRAPGRSPSPPPTPSPIREGAPDVLQSKNPVVENKTAAGMDIEGLERQVANIKTTLDTQWSTRELFDRLRSKLTTVNNLASSVAEIKSSQVCSEDVVNGIKMVIEYFQGARSEDRKWIVDAVEGQIGEMGKQLTNLCKWPTHVSSDGSQSPERDDRGAQTGNHECQGRTRAVQAGR